MPKFKYPVLVYTGVAVAGLSVSACGTGDSSTALTPVIDECAIGDTTVTFSEDNTSITVDTGPEDTASIDGLVCVLAATDTSPSLMSRIESTNSLMGWQEASENGLDYGWSFHPDNGMLMTIDIADES